MKFNFRIPLMAATAVIAIAPPGAHAVDSVSAAFATGNSTKMARAGMQWKWDSKWWQSNGTHITGYWDLTFAYWRLERYQNMNRNKHIADVGFTPVFRWQSDKLTGWYGEAGIGAHLLSEVYDNAGRRLSTAFQFGDHIGIGYVFGNGTDLGLLYQHFSNGSIKKPNNGVNFTMVRFTYPF